MALGGAIDPALSFVRNTYEADSLQAIAQLAAVDAEITFRSTAELVALSSDLTAKVAAIASEVVILDV